MEIKLLNFNHNCSTAGEYYIGRFKFIVEKNHIDNLELLTKNTSYTISSEISEDGIAKKSVVQSLGHRGGIYETAILIIDEAEKEKKSIIFKGFEDRFICDDIVVILSFLTGRQVYTENHEGEKTDKYYGSVVSKYYFSQRSSQKFNIDSFLTEIDNKNINTQFYNITYTQSINDLNSLIFYTSSNFDALITKWCKENNLSSYNFNKQEKRVLSDLKNKFQEDLRTSLLDINVDSKIVDDIVARLNIAGEPSALNKMREFLSNLGMLTDKAGEKHLKILNKVRNIMLHSGELASIEGISDDQAMIVNGCVPFIILAIIEFYLCTFYLKLNDDHYRQNFDDIKQFFETGIWREQKIFEENFEEYLERVSLDY